MTNITQICDIERAKSGKIYPAGCSYIQLSAINSEKCLKYQNNCGEIDTRYAVFIPKIECNPYYVFMALEQAIPEFLHTYQTTINLQFDTLKEIDIQMTDIENQNKFVEIQTQINAEIEQEKEIIQGYKRIKQYFLNAMFVK